MHVRPVDIVCVDTLKHELLFAPTHRGRRRGCLPLVGGSRLSLVQRPRRRAAGPRYTKGVARIEWVPDPGVRNEPLDCRVYATAELHGLYMAEGRADGRFLPWRITVSLAERDLARSITSTLLVRQTDDKRGIHCIDHAVIDGALGFQSPEIVSSVVDEDRLIFDHDAQKAVPD